MMADFSLGHDDDDAGKGLAEKNTACAMIAAILRHHGLPPTNDTVKLHKEDHATTHDCPGKDVEKPDILARVQAYYDALGTPGEHIAIPSTVPAEPGAETGYVVSTDGLNLRSAPGMAGSIAAVLNVGQVVKVWSKAKNAATTWAHITGSKDGGKTFFDGYVSFAYLHAATAAPAKQAEPTPAVSTAVSPDAWFQPGTFKASEFCYGWCRRFEKLMLTAYWDKNDWAIGYGHNNGSGVPPAVKEGDTITAERAEDILTVDVALQEHYLNAYVKTGLKQGMIDALILNLFQQGPGNFRKGQVSALVNAQSWDAAELALKNWPTTNAGLLRRRVIEAQIFNGDKPTKW